MAYLLDSDVVIYYTEAQPHTIAKVRGLMSPGVAMSVITLMEVLGGIAGNPRPLLARQRVEQLARTIPLYPFREAEARRCAQMRQALQAQGRSVRARALDLMIAATALEHNLTLVTNNQADYRDLPGLQVDPL